MLYLIGIGLDKQDISLKGLEIAKKCDKLYLDIYTSSLPYNAKEIEEMTGQEIFPAGRALLENKADDIIKEAKTAEIGILVSGDPLSATTHIDLILRARKAKVKFEIVHAASIITAVAETGLQLYKFGKIASIPKFQPNYQPESWYELMKQNLLYEAHTLLLLDMELDAEEALNYVYDISKTREDKIMDREIVICSCLGTSKSRIKVGKIKELAKQKLQEFKMPVCLALPAKLHFMEEEALKKFR